MASTAKLSTSRKIWGLLTSTERRSAMVSLGLTFVGMVLETIGVGLVIPVLALLARPDLVTGYPVLGRMVQALGNPSQQTLVIDGMLLLVGVSLVKAVFLAFLAWQQTHLAFGVQRQLSQRLFTVYLRQPYTFHLQRNSAELIRNVINEVSLFTAYGMLPGIIVLNESLTLFGLCSLLVVIEPLGALSAISVLGAAGWGFYRLNHRRVVRWGEARQHHETLRIQHLQQGLGGVKDVKLLGREDEFLEQYRLHNEQNSRAGEFSTTLQQLPRLWLELIAMVGLAILVISILAQHRALDTVLPTLGLFAAATFRLIPSANRVMSAVQSLRYCLPVINTLYDELQLDAAEPAARQRSHRQQGHAVPAFRDEIRLTNIVYTYPGAQAQALNGLSVSIKKGESVGFIGASGAGKSTLVDILLGLLTPDGGDVRVDGKNIQMNLRDWQDQIGYVPQFIFLTDDTLRRNVAFGLPNAQINEDAVRRAIRAAQLEEFVHAQPQGLETTVGERGIRLSGGQRQRIGIARALYHDPAVLVLDEATSSLDTATESGVMQAVAALQGSKTILIVAHRLSTVEQCGRLYRLEQGRVTAEGRPGAMLHRESGTITQPVA